jgi:hypothetical protein
MLAADKLQLQSAYKQQATALKEKEFNLHHSNLMTVGTQAAVLAGLDITMFIEFNPPFTDAEWPSLAQAYHVPRLLKLVYYGIIVAAFCANMLVVSHTTALSVLGAGLALRGPDGSMLVATDVVYEERKAVFVIFGYGLLLTVGSVLISVWLLLHWEAACVCWIVALVGCRQIYGSYQRVSRKLHFEEHESVDFSDILTTGPGAFRVMSQSQYDKKKGSDKNSPTARHQSSSSSSNNNNKGRRHYFKRSMSNPAQHLDQNNRNGINSSRPASAHSYRGGGDDVGGDEEDGTGGTSEYYYTSYSSEEGNDDDDDDDERRSMVGNGHHHNTGNMKQRRSNSHHQQPQRSTSQDSSSRNVIQTV